MGFFDVFTKKDENFEDGLRCMEAGNYSKAIEYFNRVTSSDRNYDRALIHILSSLTALGEDEEAIKWFLTIPSSTPHYDRAIADVVGAYTNTRQSKKVFEWATKIPTSSSYYSATIVNRLVTLLDGQDTVKYAEECDRVMADFEKLNKSEYFYPMALEYFLKVLSEYTRFKELLTYSNELLESDGSSSLGLYFRGEALYELEKYDAALECLDKIPSHSEEFVDATYVKALIHEKFGNNEEAQKCWDKVDQVEFTRIFDIAVDKSGNSDINDVTGISEKRKK